MRVMISGTFHCEDQRSICAARLRQCVAWLVCARASKNGCAVTRAFVSGSTVTAVFGR
jgi:hypothetical protein